jgi:hypothetical protein
MQNAPLSKYTVSFGLSVALCAVVNALLVVAKEKSPAVAGWLQKITGHHWVTHAGLILLLYAFCGWLFARSNDGQGPRIVPNRLTKVVVAGVAAGVFIILIFYVVAD